MATKVDDMRGAAVEEDFFDPFAIRGYPRRRLRRSAGGDPRTHILPPPPHPARAGETEEDRGLTYDSIAAGNARPPPAAPIAPASSSSWGLGGLFGRSSPVAPAAGGAGKTHTTVDDGTANAEADAGAVTTAAPLDLGAAALAGNLAVASYAKTRGGLNGACCAVAGGGWREGIGGKRCLIAMSLTASWAHNPKRRVHGPGGKFIAAVVCAVSRRTRGESVLPHLHEPRGRRRRWSTRSPPGSTSAPPPPLHMHPPSSERERQFLQVERRGLWGQSAYNIGYSYFGGLLLGGEGAHRGKVRVSHDNHPPPPFPLPPPPRPTTGVYGLVYGLRTSPNRHPRIVVNSVLNGSGKYGAKVGNAAGVLALVYTLVERQLEDVGIDTLPRTLRYHTGIDVGRWLGSDAALPALSAFATGMLFTLPRASESAQTLGGGGGLRMVSCGEESLSCGWASGRVGGAGPDEDA
jgi:hypothetical protein